MLIPRPSGNTHATFMVTERHCEGALIMMKERASSREMTGKDDTTRDAQGYVALFSGSHL